MNDFEFYKKIGEVLKEHRESQKLSAYVVAEKLGKSHQTIYYWENGTRQIYAVDLQKYCDVLGISISEPIICECRTNHGYLKFYYGYVLTVLVNPSKATYHICQS